MILSQPPSKASTDATSSIRHLRTPTSAVSKNVGLIAWGGTRRGGALPADGRERAALFSGLEASRLAFSCTATEKSRRCPQLPGAVGLGSLDRIRYQEPKRAREHVLPSWTLGPVDRILRINGASRYPESFGSFDRSACS